MIQAVVFDLFETLVTESNVPVRRASSLAAELGVSEHAYRQLWRSCRLDIVLGRSSFRDTLAQVVHTLGGTPDDSLLEHLRSERVEQKVAGLRAVEPDILSAIGTLRAPGAQARGSEPIPLPHATLAPDDLGLWHAADVLEAAMAA